MEINPGVEIFFLLIVGSIASLACMGLLILMDTLKIMRFYEKSGIIAYGIIGGIIITMLLYKADFSCHKKNFNRISIETEKLK
jgi:hypothetical protein